VPVAPGAPAHGEIGRAETERAATSRRSPPACDHIKDKFKIFPPEHHADLLRRVRQAINQLDKERKAALKRPFPE
jgi:hypothetical protein